MPVLQRHKIPEASTSVEAAVWGPETLWSLYCGEDEDEDEEKDVCSQNQQRRFTLFIKMMFSPRLPSSFLSPLVRTGINSDTNRLTSVSPPFDLSTASVSFLTKSVLVCLALWVIIGSSAEHKHDSLQRGRQHKDSRIEEEACEAFKAAVFWQDK